MTGLASVCNDCHVWKEFYSHAIYLLALMFFLPPLLQSPLSIREGGVNMFRTEPSVGTYSQHHGGNHGTAFTTTHCKENSL